MTLTLTVKTAWWVNVYLNTLQLFSMITRTEPDMKKVASFIIKHGIKTKVSK